jgi:hypothetical protein
MTTYEKIKTLINAVDSVKNERSHLECLEIVRGNEGGVRVGHVYKKTLKFNMPTKTTEDKYKECINTELGYVCKQVIKQDLQITTTDDNYNKSFYLNTTNFYRKKTMNRINVITTKTSYDTSLAFCPIIVIKIIKFKKIGGILSGEQ